MHAGKSERLLAAMGAPFESCTVFRAPSYSACKSSSLRHRNTKMGSFRSRATSMTKQHQHSYGRTMHDKNTHITGRALTLLNVRTVPYTEDSRFIAIVPSRVAQFIVPRRRLIRCVPRSVYKVKSKQSHPKYECENSEKNHPKQELSVGLHRSVRCKTYGTQTERITRRSFLQGLLRSTNFPVAVVPFT